MIYFVWYSKVINWKSNLKFPQERRLSEEAKDLISKLLCGADQRLGKGGVHEVKVISYFAPQYTLDYWKKNNRTKTLERIVKEVPWCQCLLLKICRKNECISAKHFFSALHHCLKGSITRFSSLLKGSFENFSLTLGLMGYNGRYSTRWNQYLHQKSRMIWIHTTSMIYKRYV